MNGDDGAQAGLFVLREHDALVRVESGMVEHVGFGPVWGAPVARSVTCYITGS
jgi:hypothetical protein